MPEALPELVPLALEFFCFALVWCARILAVAVLGIIADSVGNFPYLGDALRGAVKSVEQAVSNALGKVEHGIGSLVGETWHRFAQLNMWLWREFTQHSLIGWLLAQELSLLKHAYSYLHGRVSNLTHSHTAQNARVKTLERELHGIERQVKTLEREVSHGIGDDVLPRLRTLDKEIAKIENSTIPAIRAAEADAADAISNLYEWARGKATLLGVGTFSLAVATALGALGLGNLRCPAFLRALGRSNCGLGNLLEDLLGLFADVLFLEAFCDYLPEIEKVVGVIEEPLVGFISSAANGICSQPADGYEPLTVPHLHLPANPGFTLALP